MDNIDKIDKIDKIDYTLTKEYYIYSHIKDPTNIKFIHGLIYINTEEKNYTEAMNYCIKGFDLSCVKCTEVLLANCSRNFDDEKVIKVFMLALRKNINFDINKFFDYLIDKQKTELLDKLIFQIINMNKLFENIFFNYVKTNNNQRIKYICEIGVKYNNIYCMKILGDYYNNIGKNTDQMIYYYLQALSNGYYECAYLLGKYYLSIGDIDNMYKYLRIGMEKLCYKSVNALANYEFSQKNYEESERLYLIGAYANQCVPMINLGKNIYWGIKKDYKNALIYLLKAINICVFANIISDILVIINMIIDKIKYESKEIQMDILIIVSVCSLTFTNDKKNIVLDIMKTLNNQNIYPDNNFDDKTIEETGNDIITNLSGNKRKAIVNTNLSQNKK
jgi:hypothetical protein